MNPPRLDKTFRQHYHKRNKDIKEQYQLITSLVRGKKPSEPLKKCHLSIIRYSNRFLDFDNCVSSYKSYIDSLVLNGILKDDSWTITGPWSIDQKFISKKEGTPYTYLKVEGLNSQSADISSDGRCPT